MTSMQAFVAMLVVAGAAVSSTPGGAVSGARDAVVWLTCRASAAAIERGDELLQLRCTRDLPARRQPESRSFRDLVDPFGNDSASRSPGSQVPAATPPLVDPFSAAAPAPSELVDPFATGAASR